MDEPLDSIEVLRALQEWSHAKSRGARTGGGRGALDHIQLHTRPDPRGPEVQLTFRAELKDGRPVIVVSRSPAPLGEQRPRPADEADATCQVLIGPEAGSGRDPDANCEGCGVLGTIGRAVRTDDSGAITETHRFCASCRPEQSARYKARWDEEDRVHSDAFMRSPSRGGGPNRAMWFESATWHGTLEVVRIIQRTMIAPIPPSPHDLAEMAAQIREYAAEKEGEMPFEVEMFLRLYGEPAASQLRVSPSSDS